MRCTAPKRVRGKKLRITCKVSYPTTARVTLLRRGRVAARGTVRHGVLRLRSRRAISGRYVLRLGRQRLVIRVVAGGRLTR